MFFVVSDDEQRSAVICETASFVLLECLRWLYLVPSFKNLSENDQWILIEHSWSILFLLTSAELKKFLDQGSFDEDDDFLSFQSLIKELVVRSIDSTEFTLLKLILIFSYRKSKESRVTSFVEVSIDFDVFTFSRFRRNRRSIFDRQIPKGRAFYAHRIHSKREISTIGRTSDGFVDGSRKFIEFFFRENFLSTFDRKNFHEKSTEKRRSSFKHRQSLNILFSFLK